MPLDASIPLSIRPVETQSPLQTIGALQTLRSGQIENALRQQQMATNAATQQHVQAEADQQNRDLADQNTMQQLYKTGNGTLSGPEFAKSVSSWDGKSDFPLDGKVQPKTADDIKTKVLLQQKSALANTAEQTTQNEVKFGHVERTLKGILQDPTDPSKSADDPYVAANAPSAFAQLVRDGDLDARNVPDTSKPDAIRQFAIFTGHHAGLNQYALSNKKTQGEISLSAAGAAKDTATADLDNFKLSLMKGLTGPNVAASVDSLIDRTKYPQANADAHAAAQLAANSGDPAKVTEAVQKIYDEQVGSVQKATALIPSKVAEQKALIPGEVSKAGAIAQAEIPARVAGAVQTQQALAKLSPDAFATIPDPVSRREAMNESDKIDKEYSDKLTASQQLLDTIHAAQAGNKAAPGVIPIEQVRSVLANGRVNAAELRAVSSQAGSLMDRLEGWANKNTKGEPNPPDILRDMVTLETIQQQAAAQTRDAGLQRLKKRGVDTSKLAAPNIGGAALGKTTFTIPPGARVQQNAEGKHRYSIDGGKTWVAEP